MRKDKEQQKKVSCEQLKLFTRKGEPADGEAGGTSDATETGAELSSRLNQQRTLTEHEYVPKESSRRSDEFAMVRPVGATILTCKNDRIS